MLLSPLKFTLLASSIAFWWYCNNGVQNILVGIALFEVFHDMQSCRLSRSTIAREWNVTRASPDS